VQLDNENELNPSPRLEGIIKDKITFPEIKARDGSIERAAMSRYFVALYSRSQEALTDSKHVFRDRRSFNKNVLRSFLKNSVSRDRWEGAPWLVKENLTRIYHIDTTIPAKLQYDNVVAERRAMAALRKGRPDDHCLQYFASQGELPQLAEAAKAHHGKLPKHLVAQFEDALAGRPVTFTDNGDDDTMRIPIPPHRQKVSQPVVKYPIDDLEIRPRPNRDQRPAYKTFTTESAQFSQEHTQDIAPKTVGTLLEIWNTFNVHTNLYLIDSFTFDDFVDAMLFQSADIECELLNEIHCAAMKLLVDEAGVVDPHVPSAEESDGEDDDSTADNSAVSTPAPEEARRTSGRGRQSLLKNDITETIKAASPRRNGATQHRGEEMMGDTDWQSRLMIRDFTDGGWQVILVGILMHMSSVLTKEKEVCDKVVAHLAPMDQKATKETARRQYAQLDCNLRTAALEVLMMLTITSKPMKDSMERRQEQMTEDRKEKVQRQRDRKILYVLSLIRNLWCNTADYIRNRAEELHALDIERKRLFPEETTPPAEQSSDGVKSEDSGVKIEDMQSIDDTDQGSDVTDDDEAVASARRRISGRSNDLKRKREEDDARKEKEKQIRLEAKASQSAQKKVLRDIEAKKKAIRKCEEEVIHFEERLRINACHRTRLLGRDRFWNRYYWFERNGMPLAGQPTSSTAAYGYTNGRIWVQGPDDMERAGFIDLTEQEQNHYRMAFGVTVPQRRDLEEGETQLSTAYDWGYYADSTQFDLLIGWLDDRGHRERALKKELNAWRDRIIEQMEAMRAHLEQIEQKRNPEAEPVVGIATRKKTSADAMAVVRHPCLAWRNDTARRELGQLHCDGKIVPRREEREGKRGGRVTREKGAAKIDVDEPVTTRRGTRYR